MTSALIFASSIPAEPRDIHWMLSAALIFSAILAVFALYLIIRSLFTKSDSLPAAPAHVQFAPAILKWITVASPLAIVFGCCFDLYNEIFDLGIAGSIPPEQPYIFVGNFLIFLGIGLGMSLLALIGTALIAAKRHRKSQAD